MRVEADASPTRPYLRAARARSATSQVQRAVVTRLETARAKRRLGSPRKMIRRAPT